MRADLEVYEQFYEIFIWEIGHPGREDCGGEWRKFNLIVAIQITWRIGMLVERKSVWTDSRSSEARYPCPSLFLYKPTGSPAFPPQSLPTSTQVELAPLSNLHLLLCAC